MGNKIKQSLSDAHGLINMLGFDDHTYTHLSGRSEEFDGFYLTPFGLCFEEVTANNLLSVGFDGQQIGEVSAFMNRTGYVIHSCFYKQNPDLNFIFHLHTAETVAVSAHKDGLLPLSQWALHFYGRVGYVDYDSLALDDAQGTHMASEVNSNISALFLRHHGILTFGKTIEEVMFFTYHLQKACEVQCKMLAAVGGDLSKLEHIPHEICEKTVHDLLSFEKDLGSRDWQAWMRRFHRFKYEKDIEMRVA